MFEVVLTFRPDFKELIVERHATADEAQAAADRLMQQRIERVLRVWVRKAREVKTSN